jgi:hypothetical protein
MGVASPFQELYEALTAGRISRRLFMERAVGLGVGAAVATFCANAARVSASGASRRNGWAVYAQPGAAKGRPRPCSAPTAPSAPRTSWPPPWSPSR